MSGAWWKSEEEKESRQEETWQWVTRVTCSLEAGNMDAENEVVIIRASRAALDVIAGHFPAWKTRRHNNVFDYIQNTNPYLDIFSLQTSSPDPRHIIWIKCFYLPKIQSIKRWAEMSTMHAPYFTFNLYKNCNMMPDWLFLSNSIFFSIVFTIHAVTLGVAHVEAGRLHVCGKNVPPFVLKA